MLVLRIPLHIERVLLLNDCVIIPGFGGFLLRRHAAVHNPRQCAFRPARKEIVFNPTLTYDDGLLAESYMEHYGMDFNEAQQAIRHDVSALQATLADDGRLTLEGIGAFRRTDDGALLFDPASDATSTYAIGSYGLPLFYMPPLTPESAAPAFAAPATSPAAAPPVHTQPPHAVRERIPTALRVVGQTAAVAAAAVALYFSISTPVREVDNTLYTAGFVPSELLHDLSEKEQPTPRPQDEASGKVSEKATGKNMEVTIYSIVIGSFNDSASARKLISELPSEDRKHAQVVTNNAGRVRVIVGGYQDRKAAAAALAQWRQRQKFQSAWLMARH